MPGLLGTQGNVSLRDWWLLGHREVWIYVVDSIVSGKSTGLGRELNSGCRDAYQGSWHESWGKSP